MPGMMDTILDLGLNEATTRGLAEAAGSEAFAADCRRRFEEMYSEIVGVDAVPDDPWDQLRAAVAAVFRSWNSERARAYRQREGIPDDLGTAVTVQAMVFGNRSADSATGVLFTRDPATGAGELYGDVMFAAQGEDVVAGTHATQTLADLAERMPEVARELAGYAHALERYHADMCDIEFTIERGRLWLLQCRIGKRSPVAALRIAVEMAEDDDFPLTRRAAVERVRSLLADPPLDVGHAPLGAEPLTNGLPASPGLAAGEIATSADAALAVAEAGRPVILVRHETSPDDVRGMARATGLLTSRGGLASHAAVVARGWGIPAVVGASALEVDDEGVSIGARRLVAGSGITVNGSTGDVFEGILAAGGEMLPAAETLRAWAGELGVSINDGPAVPADTEQPPVHAGATLEAGVTVERDTLIGILSVKGSATLDSLAESLLTTSQAAEAALRPLVEERLVEFASGSYRLAPDGKAAAERILADDRERCGPDCGETMLTSFHALDERMKEIVTAWQMREVGGSQVLNDHEDPDYDRGVLARLGDLHREATEWLSPFGVSIARLGLYRERLERALRRASDGDARYVASPRVDSYHSTWFELHEDLIRLSGRTREEEAAAGRA